jgi:glycosyltransferase involved in cell wall biosynthesis
MPELVLHFAIPFALIAPVLGIKRALLAGFAAILPDIDALMYVHRSFTHSIPLLMIPAILLILTSWKVGKGSHTMAVCCLSLLSHPILDLFQSPTPILYPLSQYSYHLSVKMNTLISEKIVPEVSVRVNFETTNFSRFQTFDAPIFTDVGFIISLMLIGFPSLFCITNTLRHTNLSKEPGFHRGQLGKTIDVNDVGKPQRGCILFVSAYPPDKGRASCYAQTYVETVVKSYKVKFTVLVDSELAEASSRLVAFKSAWRVNNILSILALWMRVVFSKSRLAHFNLCLTTFGRGRIINFLGLLSVFYAKLSGKKVVVTLHNVHESATLEMCGLRDTFVNRLGLLLATKLLTIFSDAVVVLVRLYKYILEKRYGAKNIHFIPHGAWFLTDKPTYKVHNDNTLRVLFLGYIARYKDLQLLGEVISEIKDAELLISGDLHPNDVVNTRRFLLELLKNERVRYLGYVKDGDLPSLISRIDVVFLPYLMSPGTSGVVHLLSGLGAPFIAFPTPEMKELVNEGAGIILVNRDKELVKKTLIEFKRNKRLRAELSSKSRAFAERRAWSNVAKEYLKIYSKVLGSLVV